MKLHHQQAVLGPNGCLAAALDDGEQVVLRVTGDCMTPDLQDRAKVRVARSRLFVPGDVVAFYSVHQHRLMMHRFLGYVRSHGQWKLMTMADRGLRPDPLVAWPGVLGRVVAQSDRAYQVAPGKRLLAVVRYIVFCSRLLARHR
jgi:hypothetical protein